MNHHLKLFIEGIVQGVGFRPHVYNLARSFGLKGYVLNDSRGVTIEAEASKDKLENFKNALLKNPPRLADIQKVSSEITDKLENYDDFTIKKSSSKGEKTVLISPDIATCDDCLKEMFDPADPRYLYPFINCTNCGPRFTIITDVPYDRAYTSMSEFPMCSLCSCEYEEASNRRFHAQPVACPVCGPRLFLYDSSKNEICKNDCDIIEKVSGILKSGKIVAIKGLGGYHLACDADNAEAVKTLRSRKFREDKPFAVMAPDIDTIKNYCNINKTEIELLTSYRAPIVLLEKKHDKELAPDVAPGNKYLGVMLPYTPLHHLLMKKFAGILVMTSGNISDEPISFTESDAFERLKNIADYFLVHNRPIHIRADDTVTRAFRGEEYLIRRSRGYAPFPIIIRKKAPVPILATGAEAKNNFCLLRDYQAFVSQHIGDLENIATLKSFEEGIEHYKKLFDITPQAVAYDAHPRYLSTQYALSLPIENKIEVQHHHAHTASVMADAGLDGEVIGAALDGVGYGLDGKLWGYEIMTATYGTFQRWARLKYIKMPGGEKAVKEPWRMALSYLFELYKENAPDILSSLISGADEKNIAYVYKMLEKNINPVEISSAGRLFDAVSALLGIRSCANFEGQAAIELEMAADKTETKRYEYTITETDLPMEIDPLPIISGIITDLKNKVPIPVISGKFHNTVASTVAKTAEIIRNQTGLNRITLAGGVYQNMILLEKTINMLENRDFSVYIHKRVPANDGGISLGQAAIAAERLSL